MSATIDLRTLRPFAGCSRREVRLIAGMSTRARVRAGCFLCRQGTVGDECVVLCSGTVMIERDGAIIATASRGDVVGEMALLDETPRNRTANALALTDCDVMVFSRREFRRLCDEVPGAAAMIQLTGIRRLAQLVQHHDAVRQPVGV
jgi:CRP-like cAMP-binding protein